MGKAGADVAYLLRQHFQCHRFSLCCLQSPWSTAGGDTQSSVHLGILELLARAFEAAHIDD